MMLGKKCRKMFIVLISFLLICILLTPFHVVGIEFNCESIKSVRSNNWSEDVNLTTANSSIHQYNPCVVTQDSVVHVVYEEHYTNNTGTPADDWYAIRYTHSMDYGRNWDEIKDFYKVNTNWSSDEPVYFDPHYPDIVTNENNNIYVVWQQKVIIDSVISAYEIYFKHSNDSGQTWHNDTSLTSNDGKMSKKPCVGVNEKNIHVVWVDERSGDDYMELFYQRSTDGGVTWDDGLGNIGNVTRLTTCVPPLADYLPNIAVYGDSIHVTWTQYAGEILVKYMKSDDNGAHWTEPTTLSTTGDGHSETSNIAVSGSNVHVVWEEEKDGNTEIYYRNSSNNGEFFNPEIRLTDTSSEEYDPHITVNDSWVWVSWWNNSDNCGYYRLSKDNGITWEDPVKLTEQSGTPILAIDENNYIHAVFTSDRTGNSEIYYKRYPKFNDPPEINSFYPQTNVTIMETQDQTFYINVTDPDGDNLTYLWYLNNSLVLENETSYTFIPDGNSSGNYTVKVIVSDGNLTVNRTWLITVINIKQLQKTINTLQTQLNQLIQNYTNLSEDLIRLTENLSLIWSQLNATELNNTELQATIEQLNSIISTLYNQLNYSVLNTTELQNTISNLTQNLSSSNEQIATLKELLNQSLANQTEFKNQIIQLNETIGSLQEQIGSLKEEKELIAEEREVAEERLMIAVILLIVVSLVCVLIAMSKRKK